MAGFPRMRALHGIALRDRSVLDGALAAACAEDLKVVFRCRWPHYADDFGLAYALGTGGVTKPSLRSAFIHTLITVLFKL